MRIMMSTMRTTVTLDDDVAHFLQQRQRLTGATFKQVVNETLRAGLRTDQVPGSAPPPFRVTPKAAGFRAGVDPLRLNRLNDELEQEAFVEKLAGPGRGRGR